MRATVTYPQNAEAPVSHAPTTALACPVCTGQLIVMRNHLRCTRCGFCLCSGCEGGTPEEAADS